MRGRLATAFVVLTLLVPSVAGASPQPKTNLADVEDEVMCTVCGTLLELSDSPQAQQEKAFIQRKIDQGETKQQIKDDMVGKFGPRVLALPPASGFDLSAYIVPAVAFAAAVVGVVLGLRRWRRRDRGESDSAPLDEADAKRLDADMARYDL